MVKELNYTALVDVIERFRFEIGEKKRKTFFLALEFSTPIMLPNLMNQTNWLHYQFKCFF